MFRKGFNPVLINRMIFNQRIFDDSNHAND